MMRKLIIILVLGLGLVCRAQGQSYFNERLTLHSYFTGLTSILESNGRYYCTGFGFDSTNNVTLGKPYERLGIKFTVFDLAGNLLRDTIFQLPWRDFNSYSNNLRRLDDGSFLLASQDQDTISTYRTLIVRFDSLGHALQYKELDKPIAQADSPGFWQVVDFQPSGVKNQWLMLSTIRCLQAGIGNGIQHDFLLSKLDSNFNIIWNKQYGDTHNDIAGKLLVEANDYILAGGNNSYNIYPNGLDYKAEIIKTDTAGNVMNRTLVNNFKLTDKVNDIIRTKDGKGYVLCGGGDGFETGLATTLYHDVSFRGWVQKIDTNFNIVWSRAYNNYFYTTTFKKIIEKADGRLVVFGDKYEPVRIDSLNVDVRTSGWMMTLKANGDSLSQRTFYNARSCYDVNSFYDAKQTSDGGYVMVGESTDQCSTHTNPAQRAWIVKVDSNGCLGGDDPQCWPLSVSHTSAPVIGSYRLYPNPTQGILTVDYSNESYDGCVFHIIDLTGRIIATVSLPNKSGKQSIDISYLQPGIYLYQILENGLSKAQGKITRQ